jgi:glycogen operon protein
VRALAVWLAGAAGDLVDERYNPIIGDTMVILLNSHNEAIDFRLPPTDGEARWTLLLDTGRPQAGGQEYTPGGTYSLHGRSMAVLKHPTKAPP